MLKKYWWKVLAVILVMYASMGGLLIPLGPGVAEITPTKITGGTTESIEILTYNTQFNLNDNIAVELRSDTAKICATHVEIIAENKIRAHFLVPDTLPSNNITLMVSSKSGNFLAVNEIFAKNIVLGESHFANCHIPLNSFDSESFLFPYKRILYESIRNTFFHVPMWFCMIILMFYAFIQSILFLRKGNIKNDTNAEQALKVGLFFAFLGLITGSIWARFTWGAWWVNDVKLNGSAVTTLCYLATLVLRSSVEETNKRARLSAVYNIFAFVMLLVFLWILPNINDSLHPGNGNNAGFAAYDMNDSMKLFFRPGVLGWLLLSAWITQIAIRIKKLQLKKDEI